MAASRSFRLSPLAENDMEDVWTYSARQWSLEQAEAYTRELLGAFSDLASGRRTGTPIVARRNYLRLLVGSHAVFYQATETKIDIIRVLHQSMDVRRHL
jgi:toxin ParE1/3/4